MMGAGLRYLTRGRSTGRPRMLSISPSTLLNPASAPRGFMALAAPIPWPMCGALAWPTSGCSPAHAGIDPGAVAHQRRCARLPRTRGDRPYGSNTAALSGPAPPHTRGSTPAGAILSAGSLGSLAHAGIDPLRRCLRMQTPGLPRTRGDRPPRAGHIDRRRAAPPHTRGSTRLFRFRPLRFHGSPAHAGIDPFINGLVPGSVRLPRTRGDRPRSARASFRSRVAPPHTRGSTPLRVAEGCGRSGSPAHAGIDPGRADTTRSRKRLPRTRGDRPRQTSGRRTAAPAPPHTRGSTPLLSDNYISPSTTITPPQLPPRPGPLPAP